jgi:uncharacterized membrane protein YcaP (DUF421 family)
MDIRDLLIGDEHWSFLVETVLRTVIMFLLVLGLFTMTGKKEVRQFSVLELIVIIGLGSALGDPMLHPDTPLLPALVAITVVLLLYRAVNVWTNRSPRMGHLLEGRVRTVISDGRIDHDALREEGMSRDELLGDLRVHHVEHLGQVKAAHLEVDGELSVFFHPREAVAPGLPIAPDRSERHAPSTVHPSAHISCTHCGFTKVSTLEPGACSHCGHERWIASLATWRVE